MQEVFATIMRVAPTRATVLLAAESGVGKDLIARAIHFHSPAGHHGGNSGGGAEMLKALFHHAAPAWLRGGATSFETLTQLDGEMRGCGTTAAAVAALEKAKGPLYGRMRRRFEPAPAQAVTLKILNICLARHHQRARSTRVLSRPFGLVADPSDMCQLACPGCVHSERNEALKIFDWRPGTLTEERYAALLRGFGPYAIGMYFCNYGEPLLNLNTPKLIRMAKAYLMGTALSTSMSVKRFDADAYVESGLDFMILSIDGATQPVYERFRRNGNLELVLENVARLVEAKRRLGRRTPVLSWNFLAFEHNAHEIPRAMEMARKVGVEQFRVVNPFDVRWDDPEMRAATVKAGVRRLDWMALSNEPENWNPFPEGVEAEAIGRAFENPWNAGGESEAAAAAGHTCHWLYQNMVMDATGRILPCCGAPGPDTNLVFGSLDGGGDAFNTEMYRRARGWFRGEGDAAGGPHCTHCEWDQTAVNIGEPEIQRYFRAADLAG
jgi:MoaA/NifB/PqqE/SkfB family radical SAM enzyme